MRSAELRRGVVVADQAGDTTLAAGLRMSLSFVVGRLGDLDGAMTLLDEAEPVLARSRPGPGAQNRGMVQYWRGEFEQAAATLDDCMPCAEAARRSTRRGPHACHPGCGARAAP